MRRPSIFLLPGAVLLASAAYWLLFINYGINLDDEGTILYQVFRSYLGEIPYLDFHVGYTPGIYYLNAATFQIFGPGTLPLRAMLAAVNTLALVLLFLLARRAASGAAATIAVLVYLAFVPLHRAEFCSFNIPYPAWYVNACWLAAALTLLSYASKRRQGWLLAAGALTGVSFFFKPNAGLFQLACVAIFLLMAEHPGAPPRAARIWWRRSHGVAWWFLLASVTSGLFFIFAQAAGMREIKLFLAPVLVLIAVAGFSAVRAGAPGPQSDNVRSSHLVLSGLSVAAGFLAVTLPWLAYLTQKIGMEQILREVFLIGARFEDFYFSFHRALGARDVLIAVACTAVFALGLLVRRGSVRPWLPLAGLSCLAAAAAAVATHMLMPEGLYAALASRLEDLSFGMVQIVHWSAILSVAVAAYRGDLMADPRQRAFTLLTLTATLMYLRAYPRTDYMHLITAGAASVALGVALIDRVSNMWTAPLRGARAKVVKALFLGPLLAIALVRIAPALEGVLEIGGRDSLIGFRPQAYLGLARAPVHLEAGRSQRFQELRAVVTYLESTTKPNEAVFTFPALDIVTFLAGRDNPTRHGYFFPGWPGHGAEAEVVSDLAAKRPRFVVVLEKPTLFFFHAPSYYYILNDFLRRSYTLDREFGGYVVLRRKDVPAPLSDSRWEPVPWTDELPEDVAAEIARGLSSMDKSEVLATIRRLSGFSIEETYQPLLDKLQSPSQSVRDLAVWALRRTRSPDVATALARGVAGSRFSAARTLLALRVIEAVGDLNAAPYLVSFLKDARGRERDAALNGLAAAAAKWRVGRFWFGSHRSKLDNIEAVLGPAITAKVLKWLSDPWQDWRLRYFGAVAGAALPPKEVQGALFIALGSGNATLMEASAWSLQDAGVRDIPVTPLLPLLSGNDPAAAGLIMKLVAQGGAAVRRDLLETMEAAELFDKAQLTWLAGAIGYAEFEPPLLRMAVDGDDRVRTAAAWALGRYDNSEARKALEVLAQDDDFRVRDMARRSLASARQSVGR